MAAAAVEAAAVGAISWRSHLLMLTSSDSGDPRMRGMMDDLVSSRYALRGTFDPSFSEGGDYGECARSEWRQFVELGDPPGVLALHGR